MEWVQAWHLWNEHKAMELLDPCIRDSSPRNKALRCIHIGMLCVQDSAAHRPNMSAVVLWLESEATTLPIPTQPLITSMRRTEDREFYMDGLDVSNDLTVTMVVGRQKLIPVPFCVSFVCTSLSPFTSTYIGLILFYFSLMALVKLNYTIPLILNSHLYISICILRLQRNVICYLTNRMKNDQDHFIWGRQVCNIEKLNQFHIIKKENLNLSLSTSLQVLSCYMYACVGNFVFRKTWVDNNHDSCTCSTCTE